MNTLRVDVLVSDVPCRRRAMRMRWVFSLFPSRRPAAEEFTTTDFPGTVAMTRQFLVTSRRVQHRCVSRQARRQCLRP